MKRSLLAVFAILFFCLMLLFPEPVVQGAGNGVLLWFDIVLPTLLPFIIISNLLIKTLAIHWIAAVTAPVLCRFFHVSKYGSFAVLTGFLCGYPMGSKVTADLIKSRHISLLEGKYLLSFCNNTSPMFIISYVLIQNLGEETLFLPSLIILISSPIICSFFFRLCFFPRRKSSHMSFSFDDGKRPQKQQEGAPENRIDGNIIDGCIMNGFETITKIGGYIILFSILIELSTLLPVSHPLITAGLFPSLEITSGIASICRASISPGLIWILCLALTSFGGWCSIAQTECMIQGSGLSIFPYMIQKLITAAVTSSMAFIYLLL